MDLKSTPKQKDLIYDVGMHKGQDTDFYLKKGYRVIAFEANPENVAFGQERFSKEIKEKRLIIVEGAIVENISANGHQPSVVFYRNLNHSFWGSTCDDWAYRNEVMGTSNEIIEVKAVDFGHCVEKYGVPFYLKADIVGSENICLKALLEFEHRPDYISIRSEKVIFSKLEEEIDLLEKLGYHEFKAIQQEFGHLKIPLETPDGENIVYSFEEGASGTFGEDTPGKWKDRRQIIRSYQNIFVLYWLFGDFSYLIQTERGRKFIVQLERISRRSLPGWYDTHARHFSHKS